MEPATVVMLCVAALYVSSLNTNGLRALLVTGPAIALAVLFGLEVLWRIADAAQPVARSLSRVLQPIVEIDRGDYAWWARHGLQWWAAGLALPLLLFGYANHRTADRNVGRVVRQLGWLSVYVVAGMVFLSVIGHLFTAWLQAGPGR